MFYSRKNWQNCSGFVQGTVLRISRPKINQNTLFITVTSEYTASSFKVWLYLMDSLVTLVAPVQVNGMIVPCYTSLGYSQIYRDQYWHNNQPPCIYGDPAYPLSIHIQAPFSRQNLTPNSVNCNNAMSQNWDYVVWLFNEIETYFKFISYTNIYLFPNSP